MGEKITTCKPSLLSSRTDFNYRFEFTDTNGAVWEFGLHTMNARQRGAVQASFMIVKVSNEGKPQPEIESNMELYFTALIMNAIDSWNLEDAITINNVELMPKDVRSALVEAIKAHEGSNDLNLESDVKN
jgi:hypothetical protein